MVHSINKIDESINSDCSGSDEENINKPRNVFTYYPEEDDAHESSDTIKWAKGESLSCYCSASHTDNISTDEHDSLLDSHTKSVHLSDSGADLTEDISSVNSAWHKYWTSNGERLIWKSWIAKYSAYINPEYLETIQTYSEANCSQATDANLKDSFDTTNSPADSFDFTSSDQGFGSIQVKDPSEHRHPNEVLEKNRMLVRNLSYSDSYDKLSREIEGWNPLSPMSIDGENCEAAERLLSSRCVSRTGSSAKTFDSMTNVTHLTVSSFDLSESSKSPESFSSVSSIHSSITSTSSEETEETADYDQQWNTLWTKHYEQEYLDHYKKFTLENCEKMKEKPDTKHSQANVNPGANNSKEEMNQCLNEKTTLSSRTRKRNNKKQKRKQRRLVNVPELIKRENEIHTDPNKHNSESEMLDVSDVYSVDTNKNCDCLVSTSKTIIQKDLENVTENKMIDENEQNVDVEYCDYLEDNEAMVAMGIPLEFGIKTSVGKDYTSSKKYSTKDNSDQSSSNRIKAAFSLLGIEMQTNQYNRFKGSVKYKMRNIKGQNKGLYLRPDIDLNIAPKHHYFNEDGEIISEEVESNVEDNEVTVQNSHQDELLGLDLSYSNEETKTPDGTNLNQRTKSKKSKRKRKACLPIEINENRKLLKFWHRRYSLFSRFDEGIKLDEESWFSVTPEVIGKHIAERCSHNDVIIDGFCGAGGNTIQFAQKCKKVIAIDIDPKKIEIAKNNACVYGVEEHIEFIVGDFFQLAGRLKADAVFLSPPWGGLQYRDSNSVYDLRQLQPLPFDDIWKSAWNISPNLAFFLPKNTDTYPLVTAAGPGGKMEVEQNFLGKRLISITAYYGNLIKEVSAKEDEIEGS